MKSSRRREGFTDKWTTWTFLKGKSQKNQLEVVGSTALDRNSPAGACWRMRIKSTTHLDVKMERQIIVDSDNTMTLMWMMSSTMETVREDKRKRMMTIKISSKKTLFKS